MDENLFKRRTKQLALRMKYIIGLLLIVATLAVCGVEAQEAAKKAPRIGFLGNSTAALEANRVGPFRDGLRDLGYIEGPNILIEYRWAEDKNERLPALMAELIALQSRRDRYRLHTRRPSVSESEDIDSSCHGGRRRSRRQRHRRLPQPARRDYHRVDLDLTRAGGQTDRSCLSSLAIPKLSHIAVLWNPVNAFHVIENKQVEAAAAALRMKVFYLGVQKQEQFEKAFSQIQKERPKALLVLADRVFLHNRARIMEFAVRHRLPGVYAYVELVEAGGLMSYGPSYPDMHRRAAIYVDKILKGRKPADLPVERPMKFELVVNLKPAKQIGVTIPPNVLARADRVIK